MSKQWPLSFRLPLLHVGRHFNYLNPRDIESHPSACVPADPATSAGVIIVTTPPDEQGNLQVEIQSDESRQVGACTCGNAAKQSFFATLTTPLLDQSGGGNPYGNVVDVHCRDPPSLCVCNHGGECFKQMGTNETLRLQLYPYCDDGGCFMYTVPLCSNPEGNNVTGLVSTKNPTKIFECADAFGDGDVMLLGSNSTFIRAFAVSCKGCGPIKDIRQSGCHAPFTKSSGLDEYQTPAYHFIHRHQLFRLRIARTPRRGFTRH